MDAVRVTRREPAATGTATGRVRLDHLGRLARAVLDCPQVVKLYPGPTGRIATATTTGRVVGLLFQGGRLVIGVLGIPTAAPDEVSDRVRAAVRPLVPAPVPVTVVVSSPGRDRTGHAPAQDADAPR